MEGHVFEIVYDWLRIGAVFLNVGVDAGIECLIEKKKVALLKTVGVIEDPVLSFLVAFVATWNLPFLRFQTFLVPSICHRLMFIMFMMFTNIPLLA